MPLTEDIPFRYFLERTHGTIDFLENQDISCQRCDAKSFKSENRYFCCGGGKIQSCLLSDLPKFFEDLLNGEDIVDPEIFWEVQ